MSAARLGLAVLPLCACMSWSEPGVDEHVALGDPLARGGDEDGERFVLVSSAAPWFRTRDDDVPLQRMTIDAPDGPPPVVQMRLVEVHDDRVLVRPVQAETVWCTPWLGGPDPNGLVIDLWVDREALVPVLTERTTLAWSDGTSLTLRRGVAVFPSDGHERLAVAQGMILRIEPPASAIGLAYERDDSIAVYGFEHSVPGDRPLRYANDRIAGGLPPHGARWGSASKRGERITVGVHEPRQVAGTTLAAVANDCALLVADVGTPDEQHGPGQGNGWSAMRWPLPELYARNEQVFDRLRHEAHASHGWFRVKDAPAYWADGVPAGRTQHSMFAFPPQPIGERLCFEQMLAPGLVRPICFDRQHVQQKVGEEPRPTRYDIASVAMADDHDYERMQRALRRHVDEARRCHVDSGAAAYHESGSFALALGVRPDGTIASAGPAWRVDDIELTATMACVARAALRWRLPKAKAPYRTEVHWDIRD